MAGPAMKRGACAMAIVLLAGCGHSGAAVDDVRPLAGRAPANAPLDAETLATLSRLEAAVKDAPADHAAADRYREFALQHGAKARAVKWLSELAADPTAGREANIHFQLAMAYVDVLKTSSPVSKPPLSARALASFDAALERDPNLWDAWYGKGLLYLNMPASFRQYPKAIEVFTELLQRQGQLPQRPGFALTYIRLSEAYVQAGDRRRAAAVLRDGLRRFPDVEPLQDQLSALEQEQTKR